MLKETVLEDINRDASAFLAELTARGRVQKRIGGRKCVFVRNRLNGGAEVFAGRGKVFHISTNGQEKRLQWISS